MENLRTSLNGEVIRKNIDISDTNNSTVQNITCNIIPINLADKNYGDFMLLLHDYSREKKMQDIINSNEKMKTVGKLAAGIAHEIRNPLTSIKAFVELIPYKIENVNFRNELIEVLPSEIQRINNLVTSLLDFAKPRNAVPQIIKIKYIIDEIHTFIKVSLDKKNIKFATYLDYEFVFADVQQLKQILINTILNSIDAIENGGKIEIISSIKNNLTEIEVTDNGCGIPEKSLHKIFDPFYSLKSNGYGLGLPNILQLLKENNGSTKIESTQGVGTTVFIYLPSAQREDENFNEQNTCNR
jgi:polar amino acid transport system substrate-binding protein